MLTCRLSAYAAACVSSGATTINQKSTGGERQNKNELKIRHERTKHGHKLSLRECEARLTPPPEPASRSKKDPVVRPFSSMKVLRRRAARPLVHHHPPAKRRYLRC